VLLQIGIYESAISEESAVKQEKLEPRDGRLEES
jgi:hypothetical protein